MKKKILLIACFVFLALILTASLWLYEGKYFVGRASTVQQDFSPDNSYVFITPLKAAANGQEQIRATVFILNSQGLGVPGRIIGLSTVPNLTIQTIQGTTDNYGRAVFDVSSKQRGEYYLEVTVGDKKLPQQVHLSFY